MDFTEKRQTDLMLAFDNWYDMHNIVTTFRHMGFSCDETPEEYLDKVHKLHAAMFNYPELPLHEAYVEYLKNPVPIKAIPQNLIYKKEVTSVPCKSCGGGKVR